MWLRNVSKANPHLKGNLSIADSGRLLHFHSKQKERSIRTKAKENALLHLNISIFKSEKTSRNTFISGSVGSFVGWSTRKIEIVKSTIFINNDPIYHQGKVCSSSSDQHIMIDQTRPDQSRLDQTRPDKDLISEPIMRPKYKKPKIKENVQDPKIKNPSRGPFKANLHLLFYRKAICSVIPSTLYCHLFHLYIALSFIMFTYERLLLN